MTQNLNAPLDVVFGPFRFDLLRGRLWRGQEAVSLRAKPLAVLRYLLEHPGQLVTRDEILKEVWAGTYVTATAVRVCLREIRRALGDDATTPQYIETVGRQGYRFIAPFAAPPAAHDSACPLFNSKSKGWIWQPPPHFVGREEELARLEQCFEAARSGQRQFVFVTGEPGIGKTALINMFLHQIQQNGSTRLAHGQCVEQYGGGTPYLPLLDALGRLCQESGADHLVRIFEHVAPMWLAQLPALLSSEQRRALSHTVIDGAQARMLCELADLLAVLSAERPVVLVLEDLHWSDSATVEALAYVARRQDPARLLVLGVYRPADLVVSNHPLHGLLQELFAHKLSDELCVELLSEEDVDAYVTQRLVDSPLTSELSVLIHQRTDGNALFVVSLVDYLFHRGLLQKATSQRLTAEEIAALQTALPEGLQQLIVKQVERLSPEERRCLEVASVVGRHFTAAAVAAADKLDQAHVETICEGLVRKQQLLNARAIEEWPSGSLTASYEFQHAVYQQVTYSQIGRMRQVRLHRAIGEWLEGEYGTQATEIAAQLAVHFEGGREPRHAAHYRWLAAGHALRHNAYREVYLHGTAGLSLIEIVSDITERKQLELEFLQLLSAAVEATRGFLDDELQEYLQRARQLCHELKDDTALASVLLRLGRRHLLRADRAAMEDIGQAQYRLAERVQDAKILLHVYPQLATSAVFRGQHAQAAEHFQRFLQQYDPKTLPFSLASFGGDPSIVVFSWSGVSVSLAGQLDLGWCRAAQALSNAEALRQPYVLTHSLLCATMVRLLRGDSDEAWQLAHQLETLAGEYRISLYHIGGMLLQGCIAVQRHAWTEGVETITAGLAQYRAVGAQLLIPFFLSFLAQGYGRQGNVAEALQVVNEALALTATNLDVFWTAELYRLAGELSRQKGARDWGLGAGSPSPQAPSPQSLASSGAAREAEEYFLQAIDIARQQGAKLLELRATTSLARLWQRQNKQHEARAILSALYNWFTEGFNIKDLQEAKMLLADLT